MELQVIDMPYMGGSSTPQQPSIQDALDALKRLMSGGQTPQSNNPFEGIFSGNAQQNGNLFSGNNSLFQQGPPAPASPQFPEMTSPISSLMPGQVSGQGTNHDTNPFGTPYQNTGDISGSHLMDLINQAKPGETQLSPQEELMQQLMSAMPQIMDPQQTQDLMNQEAAGINKSFGAQIGALQHQNAGAKADTKQGTKKIQAMYRALAGDMKRNAQREMKAGQHLAGLTQNLGQQGADAAQKSAESILATNAAHAQALGAPELMGTINPAVNEQTLRAADMSTGQAARSAARTLGMAGASQRFFNESSGASRVEGTNRSADLIGQLQDYLQNNRSKMADLSGQRAAAVANLKNSVLQQNTGDQFGQQQQIFEDLMNLGQFNQSMQPDPAQQFDPNSLLPKGTQYNLMMQQQDPALAQAYQAAMSSPQAQTGSIDMGHNNQVPLSSTAGQALLAQMFGGSLTPQEMQALINMLSQAQYGGQ